MVMLEAMAVAATESEYCVVFVSVGVKSERLGKKKKNREVSWDSEISILSSSRADVTPTTATVYGLLTSPVTDTWQRECLLIALWLSSLLSRSFSLEGTQRNRQEQRGGGPTRRIYAG